MKNSWKIAFAGLFAGSTLMIGSIVSAHDDPASGHFYCDDTSQNGSCGFNKTTGFTTKTITGAAGGSSSLADETTSFLQNYHTANWSIQTNDRVGTGNWYGWDVFIPNYGGSLNDTARYFVDGTHFGNKNQNAYQGSWVWLGDKYMSDSTLYKFTVDNYRGVSTGSRIIADAIHLYD